jgi:hypothetical protein
MNTRNPCGTETNRAPARPSSVKQFPEEKGSKPKAEQNKAM